MLQRHVSSIASDSQVQPLVFTCQKVFHTDRRRGEKQVTGTSKPVNHQSQQQQQYQLVICGELSQHGGIISRWTVSEVCRKERLEALPSYFCLTESTTMMMIMKGESEKNKRSSSETLRLNDINDMTGKEFIPDTEIC